MQQCVSCREMVNYCYLTGAMSNVRLRLFDNISGRYLRQILATEHEVFYTAFDFAPSFGLQPPLQFLSGASPPLLSLVFISIGVSHNIGLILTFALTFDLQTSCSYHNNRIHWSDDFLLKSQRQRTNVYKQYDIPQQLW